MLGTSKLGLSRNGSWVYQASGWYHSEWLTILQISVFNWWYPPHFWLEGRFVSILAGYILLFAGFFAQHVGWSSPLCSYPPHESGMCWVTAVHHEIVASFPTWIPALVADIPLLTWNPQLYITYVFSYFTLGEVTFMEIPNHSPHLHPELTLQGHSPSCVSSWQLHRRTGLHLAGLNLLEIHLMKLLEFRNLVRTDRERWVNSWPFSYDTRSCSRRKHDLQQSMAEDVMNVIKFDWSWRCSAFSSKNHLIWMKHRHVTYSMGSKTSHFRTRPALCLCHWRAIASLGAWS